MEKMIVMLGASMAALVLTFNLAFAGEGKVPEFEEVDINQDGAVNTEEAAQVPSIASLFNGADLDQDGKLNAGEYERAKRHIDSKNTEEAE